MNNTFSKILIFFLTFFLKFCSSSSSSSWDSSPVVVTHSVVSYGAREGGEHDTSEAFVSAWREACGSVHRSEIYVPNGEYLISRPVVFSGRCRSRGGITVRMEGTLLAPLDYRVLGESKNWLLFNGVDGVFINGGTLDARASGLWDCKNSHSSTSTSSCPLGATSIEFRDSRNIVVKGMKSKNSQLYHIVILGCNNVRIEGVDVSAAEDSPNTDGIHVQSSQQVSILNSVVATGDDCVSIGPATSRLYIQSMLCGPGHGISIGSLGKEKEEGGVSNVTVRGCRFEGTKNGVRIKSWARPSSSFVRHVVFEEVTMLDVQNPILIDQHYCPDHISCPQKASGVRISDVKYKAIRGTSATRVAVRMECSSSTPCTNIEMQDITLTFNNQPRGAAPPAAGFASMAACTHASGFSSGSILPSGCL